MKKVADHVAGICGLFCGTCPAYPKTCEGCLSDKLQYMKDYGIDAFLDAQVHKTTCPECGEFIIWYETECRKCGWEK